MAFFYHAFTKLGGHLLHIGAVQVQFLGNLPVGQVQSHKIEAQYPYFEWLMMSRKNGARQIIEAFATIFTFIALFGRFFFIESSFDYSFGITKRTLACFRPAQFPNSFITLSIINQRLYVYLHPLGAYGELSQKIYPLPLYDPETQHEPKKHLTKIFFLYILAKLF